MRTLLFFIVCAVGVLWGASKAQHEKPHETIQERSFSAPSYEVVDLSARRFSGGSVLVINGFIYNSSFAPTSGRVVIYVGQGNNILLTLEESVNGGAPFAHGARAFFEASTSLDPKQPLDTVMVEYVPNQVVLNKKAIK